MHKAKDLRSDRYDNTVIFFTLFSPTLELLARNTKTLVFEFVPGIRLP